MRSAILALAVIGACLTGCGDDGGGGTEAVGTLLTGWSEAYDDTDAVRRFEGEPRLVSDQADLDAVVELASPELATDDIADADLDQVVLVLGAYPRCDESSTVELADDGATLRFIVTIPDNPVDCVWAPLQVDVWAVPRDGLADDVSLESPDRP